jgi:protein-S-isoprenylcysteine O-methyltransferase Ste14
MIYISMFYADKLLIVKFGKDYEDYMKKVPRANFIWGIIKYLRRKKDKI